jgi:hypothetical protein
MYYLILLTLMLPHRLYCFQFLDGTDFQRRIDAKTPMHDEKYLLSTDRTPFHRIKYPFVV